MQQTVATVMALKQDADQVITVAASASVLDAVDTLAENRIGAVLVRNDDGLVDGIFTERDLLLRVVHPRLDPGTTPLSLVMTRDVRFVSPGTTIEAAMALMQVNRFRHLLVMDGPRVLGLVSMGDMTNHLIRHGEGRFEAAVRGRIAGPAAERAPKGAGGS
jgi:CBS domain-containing protein